VISTARTSRLPRPRISTDVAEHSRAWHVAANVPDPELPVLTIGELGILRDVTVDDQGRVHVQVTPTYSGCPAMETIRTDLIAELTRSGYLCVSVEFVLAPAWTTDWMSDTARAKLTAYGIAPPGRTVDTSQTRPSEPVPLALSVRCPQCGSLETRELSRFGSTACKSLWVCADCREPFDHFKAH
jgi:ring-1,2-phenylacetyl-CoA epoxidase subunit PaaD